MFTRLRSYVFTIVALSLFAAYATAAAQTAVASRDAEANTYLPVVIGLPAPPVPPATDRTIIYSKNESRGRGIYAIESDGTSPTPLTQTAQGDYSPRWSPDRHLIAFVRLLPTSASQLMVMNADGSGVRVIPTPKLDMIGGITWSPDGSTLAFNAYTKYTKWDIYRVSLNGSGLTNLTADLPGTTSLPDWSPDGTRILFSYRQHMGYGQFDLWLMNPDGSDPVNLTDDEPPQYAPRWSPDGTTILFEATPEGSFNVSLYTMPAAGGPSQLLLDNAGEASWSPDGSQIVFVGLGEGGAFEGIFRANADGRSIVPLDENEDAHSPDW